MRGFTPLKKTVCFTEKDGHYYDVEIVDYH